MQEMFTKQERLKMIANFMEQKLADLRRVHGQKFGLPDMERMTGVSQITMNRTFNGRFIPSAENMQKIADGLGAPRLYDLCGVLRPDTRLWELLKIWDQLTDTDLRDLLKAANDMAANNQEG